MIKALDTHYGSEPISGMTNFLITSGSEPNWGLNVDNFWFRTQLGVDL
jgi:hypothetical protein